MSQRRDGKDRDRTGRDRTDRRPERDEAHRYEEGQRYEEPRREDGADREAVAQPPADEPDFASEHSSVTVADQQPGGPEGVPEPESPKGFAGMESRVIGRRRRGGT